MRCDTTRLARGACSPGLSAPGLSAPGLSAHGLSVVVVLVASLASGGCATTENGRPELGGFAVSEGIPYTVKLEREPPREVRKLLEESLRLYTLADRPPPSEARLRRRAEADLETVDALLRSEGYYDGRSRFSVAPAPAPEEPPSAVGGAPSPGDPEYSESTTVEVSAAAAPGLVVTLTVEPGDRYTVAEHALRPPRLPEVGELPRSDALGLPAGAPARAADVVAAEERAVQWLRDRGYPYARYERRRTVADPQARALRITSWLEPGPFARMGEVSYEGLRTVDESYLRTYETWADDAPYSAATLAAFQRRLYDTSLFEALSARPVEEDRLRTEGEGKVVPLEVEATEAKHRTVGGGVRYSTDDGPGANAFIEHRNLLGANERGRLSVLVSRETREAAVSFRKPQFRRDGQSLLSSLALSREDNDAFDERAVRGHLGIERVLSKRLTAGIGVGVKVGDVTDADPTGTSKLLSLPAYARYDASDSLLDPTAGYRLSGALTPYVGTFDDNDLLFAVLDLHGSAYWPVTDDRRIVVAGRTRLATLVGEPRDDVPSPERLYAGGGGSVRGYKTRYVGPLNADDHPIGGRSALELGLELRIRLGEDFGLVPFVDAGSVSESELPDFDEGLQYAAGLGLRYHTVVGPIRADVAFPVDRREVDDPYQLYVSIGQAF